MPWTRGSLLWVRTGRESTGTVFVLRKSIGTAVARNRLKRRLRSICRDHPLAAVGSLVVLAQPSAANATFEKLRDELARLLSLLREGSG